MDTILAADIGATKVNVASFARKEGKWRLTRFGHYLTREWSGLLSILQNYRALSSEESAMNLAIGVAGPVVEGRDAMTNLSWSINPDKLKVALGLSQVVLLNDLAAFGWGISELEEEGTQVLQSGKASFGNKAVIAVGTGLGQCTLFKNGMDYGVSASEGGHTDFGPCNEEELALLEFLLARDRHRISWERVVSGKYGFKNIYEFLRETGRAEENTTFSKAVDGLQEIGPPLVAAALDHVVIAEKTIALFSSLYSSKAGNIALEVLPTEGIYFCGGITQKILPWIKTNSFLDSFSNKGRMSSLLKDIPIYLVTDPHVALKGLARYACETLRIT